MPYENKCSAGMTAIPDTTVPAARLRGCGLGTVLSWSHWMSWGASSAFPWGVHSPGGRVRGGRVRRGRDLRHALRAVKKRVAKNLARNVSPPLAVFAHANSIFAQQHVRRRAKSENRKKLCSPTTS